LIAVPHSDEAGLTNILASARVMIAPVFSTGLTTKVLIGMANGIPVVTTHMAAAGYKWSGRAQDVESAMAVASSPSAFAAKVTSVYSNPAEWSQLSTNGLALAKSHASGEQFQADVVAIVASLSAPIAPKAPIDQAVHFIAASALPAHESSLKAKQQKLVEQNLELFAGTGGSSSSGDEETCATQVAAAITNIKNKCVCTEFGNTAASCITKLCAKGVSNDCTSAVTAGVNLIKTGGACATATGNDLPKVKAAKDNCFFSGSTSTSASLVTAGAAAIVAILAARA
jgi:hypothetical protein